MRSWIIIGIVALIACIILLIAVQRGNSLKDEGIRLVNCSDIPKIAKLIGRFGVPLGEKVVTIRGKWKCNPDAIKPVLDPTKTSDFNFVVTSINGESIQSPIKVPWDFVEPISTHGHFVMHTDNEHKWQADWGTGAKERVPQAFADDEWEMMGFEAGRAIGWPREIGRKYKYVQQIYGPGAFVTTFNFATVRIFGKPHEKSEIGGYTLGPDEPDEVEESSENTIPSKQTGTGIF